MFVLRLSLSSPLSLSLSLSLSVKRIEREKMAVAMLKQRVDANGQQALRNLANQHEEALKKTASSTEMLAAEKKMTLESVQKCINDIRDAENDFQERMKSRKVNADQALAQIKRVFREGAEERLRAAIQAKKDEYLEYTGRALAPEISRLRSLADSEAREKKTQGEMEAKRQQAEMQRRLHLAIQEETKKLHEQHHSNASKQRALHQRTLEGLEREHSNRLARLREEHEESLGSLRYTLQNKQHQQRHAGLGQTQSSSSSAQDSLKELRQQHLREVSNLQKDHQTQLARVRAEADERKAALKKALQESDRFRVDEAALSAAAGSEMKHQRDVLLRQRIERTHAETLRHERASRQRFTEDRELVLESAKTELQSIEASKRAAEMDDTEAAVFYAELAEQLVQEEEALALLKQQLAVVQRDVQVYEKGISNHELRLRDAELRTRLIEAEAERTLDSRVGEFKARRESAREKERYLSESHARELRRAQEQYDTELARLDRQVKMDILRKDEEINVLRDAVHTEKIKGQKLREVIQQYES
jgi:hypothetical protein